MNMRVCTEIATGKLIEAQSGAAPYGTLRANALAAGYVEADVEEKVVSQAEYLALREAAKPAPSYRQERAAAYAAEMGLEPGQSYAIGDTLDEVLGALETLAGDAAFTPTPGLRRILDKRAEIKTRIPKPV